MAACCWVAGSLPACLLALRGWEVGAAVYLWPASVRSPRRPAGGDGISNSVSKDLTVRSRASHLKTSYRSQPARTRRDENPVTSARIEDSEKRDLSTSETPVRIYIGGDVPQEVDVCVCMIRAARRPNCCKARVRWRNARTRIASAAKPALHSCKGSFDHQDGSPKSESETERCERGSKGERTMNSK